MLPAGLAEDCIYEYPQADWNDRPHGRNLPGEWRLEAEWLQHDRTYREGQPHAALRRSGGYLGLDPVRLRSWLRQGGGARPLRWALSYLDLRLWRQARSVNLHHQKFGRTELVINVSSETPYPRSSLSLIGREFSSGHAAPTPAARPKRRRRRRSAPSSAATLSKLRSCAGGL